MNVLETVLRNPTGQNQSYAWFPAGLFLPPGATRRVEFDPLTLLRQDIGKRRLCEHDIRSGRITFTYLVSEPAMVETTAFEVEVTNPVVATPAAIPMHPNIHKAEDQRTSVLAVNPDSDPDALTISVVAAAPVSDVDTEKLPPLTSMIVDPTFRAGQKRSPEGIASTPTAEVIIPVEAVEVTEVTEATSSPDAPTESSDAPRTRKKKSKNQF